MFEKSAQNVNGDSPRTSEVTSPAKDDFTSSLPMNEKQPSPTPPDSASFVPSVELTEERAVTTRWELYAYYTYYIGNNGLSGFNFGPSAFQNLLYLAATCDVNNSCTLPFAGTRKSGVSQTDFSALSLES